MNTVFVLLMLWGGATTQSGIAVVQHEFGSQAACETARAALALAHGSGTNMHLRAQGCFKK